MTKVRTKGTALQLSIASVYTTIAQVISLDKDEMQSETFEADTLDNSNAGIPYESTGRTEGGSISGELFLEPAASNHQSLIDLLTTPPAVGSPSAWKLIFADSGATEWSFSGAGFGLGATVALSDGLKAPFSVKLTGLPTFP